MRQRKKLSFLVFSEVLHIKLSSFCRYFFIFWHFIYSTSINDVLKPDRVSVVTAHMVYCCGFARSEIFRKNAGELGVGSVRRQWVIETKGVTRHKYVLVSTNLSVDAAAIEI